jgi:hypothetical protein
MASSATEPRPEGAVIFNPIGSNILWVELPPLAVVAAQPGLRLRSIGATVRCVRTIFRAVIIMKRRHVLQTITGLSLTGGLPLPSASQETSPPKPATETPLLETGIAEACAEPSSPRFFSTEQFAALHHLVELLMPGAKDSGVAAFLDFLVSESPADRQSLYRDGLDRLNTEARKRYGKPFQELTKADADGVLAPLREPWTYSGPSDPFARFLHNAKLDAIRATTNSREWAIAQQKSGRRAGGVGTYWYSVD